MSDRPIELIFGFNDTNPLDVTWGPWMLAGMDYRPARKRVDLITSEDADGAIPLGQSHSDNMMIGLRLRVDEGASMDAALDQMHRLQKKLDDAARRSPDGLECVWRPEGASERSTFFVLEGEIAEAPQEMSGADIGWYHKSPILVVTLICKPFFYGDWSTPVTASTSGGSPTVSVNLSSVGGDVDAEGELTITDTASKNRTYCEWGLEQYGYDPGSPPSILLDLASGLTVSGYNGTSSTESGSNSANTVEGTARTTTGEAVCGTSGQAHVGTKRIKARVKGSTTAIGFRLRWRVGDGQYSTGDWTYVPQAAEFCEVDLGAITINPPESGTHKFEAVVEVADADAALGTYVIDYVEVLPAERFSKIRVPQPEPRLSLVKAQDNFGSTSGALAGDTATLGGTWAHVGGVSDSVDFTETAAPDNSVIRTELSDASTDERYARINLLGSTTYSTGRATVTSYSSLSGTSLWAYGANRGAVLGVDVSNFLVAYAWAYSSGYVQIAVAKVIGGTATDLVVPRSFPASTTLEIGIERQSGGAWVAYLDGEAILSGVDSGVAAMADCKPGIFDWKTNATAETRTYTDFVFDQLSAPNAVCYSGESLIIAHDRAERYDSTGVYTSEPPQVRGSRLWIPPAGDQGKTTRVTTKLRRYDLDTQKSPLVDTDEIHSISVRYRPRYRAPIGTT